MMTRERFKHYMLGIQHVDDDHWQILSEMDAVIAKFHDQSCDCSELSTRMQKVVATLARHLVSEENYMESIAYPYLAYHIKSHITLVAAAKSVVTRINEMAKEQKTYNSIAFMGDMLREIEDKLLNHIDYYDMPVMDWVRKQSAP